MALGTAGSTTDCPGERSHSNFCSKTRIRGEILREFAVDEYEGMPLRLPKRETLNIRSRHYSSGTSFGTTVSCAEHGWMKDLLGDRCNAREMPVFVFSRRKSERFKTRYPLLAKGVEPARARGFVGEASQISGYLSECWLRTRRAIGVQSNILWRGSPTQRCLTSTLFHRDIAQTVAAIPATDPVF